MEPSEDGEELPEPQPSKYTNSKVHVGAWWEERAWTERTDGQRAPPASRPFGRRELLSPSETLARSDGHATSDLTSMGHKCRSSTSTPSFSTGR